MADYYTTPLPTVGVTTGPTWASTVNEVLTLVEGHGHTGTDEVQVTPPGMNINGPLSFHNNDLSAVGAFTADTGTFNTVTTDTLVVTGSATIATQTINVITNTVAVMNVDATVSGALYRSLVVNTIFNLPAPVPGLYFYFDASSTPTTIMGTGGGVIALPNQSSSSNGSAITTFPGSTLLLVCVSSVNWRAQAVTGSWTLS